MKYAIISDIHSNLQALNSALGCIKQENVDKIICLGDIVGYNANPFECIKVVKNHPLIKHIVQGNHDSGVARYDKMTYSEAKDWSDDANYGLRYSRNVLKEKDLTWLGSLSEREIVEDSNISFLIRHYSPCGFNSDWGYVLNKNSANNAINFLKAKKINLAFFGHSHLPTLARTFNKFSKDIDFVMGNHVCECPIEIKKGEFYAINCGAIGQPRNKGYTTYGIFDSDKMVVNIKPFEYNIKEAQAAIMNAKYSSENANLTLAKRLG